jgi:serine/threonine protein kinase
LDPRALLTPPLFVSLSSIHLLNFSCDFWALGAIVYQMLAGLPPFRAANEYLVFQKIINTNYTFPQGFPAVAKDLVEKLIVCSAFIINILFSVKRNRNVIL